MCTQPVVLNIHSTGTEVVLIWRYSCDYTEYWERRLMLFPESQWVVFEFRRNHHRQVMIDFIGCCIGCWRVRFSNQILSQSSALSRSWIVVVSIYFRSFQYTNNKQRSVESAIPCSYWTMLFWLKRSRLQYTIVFVTSRSGLVGLAARGLQMPRGRPSYCRVSQLADCHCVGLILPCFEIKRRLDLFDFYWVYYCICHRCRNNWRQTLNHACLQLYEHFSLP